MPNQYGFLWSLFCRNLKPENRREGGQGLHVSVRVREESRAGKEERWKQKAGKLSFEESRVGAD